MEVKKMKHKFLRTIFVIVVILSACVPPPPATSPPATVSITEVTSTPLLPTPVPSETSVPTSIPPSPTATSTFTPSPNCMIEDFESVRRGTWWSPDPSVFSYQETSQRAIDGNQSFRVNYTKSDTYQYLAFEPGKDFCSFQNGNNLHVWVYGKVTLLLKLEDNSGKGVDVSEQANSVPDNWALLVFNYAGAADQIDLDNIKNIMLFPMPGNASATGTFYLDDISLYP